jgi:superfamily II DNA helicase RecQ
MLTKVCHDCKKRKKVGAYSRNCKAADGYCDKCKDCHKAYQRAHYRRNAAMYKAKAKRWDAANRVVLNALIADFRKSGCAVCKEPDHSCLCAHHRNPKSKELTIGEVVNRSVSPRRVRKELAKCVCLCLNCHAKLHANKITLS